MTAILGIDPGLSGALALYTPGSIEIFDMPVVTSNRGGTSKKDIDAYALGILIDSIKHRIKHAIIENVGGVGKQSAARSFQFGLSTGIVHGILAANLIPYSLVAPQKWKAAYGLKRPEGATDAQYKSMSRAKASSLFPEHAHRWALSKHDGRAEALLIAVYGAKHGS